MTVTSVYILTFGIHIFLQTDAQAEVEQLRKELMNTVGLYNQAFEDFVHAQNKVSDLLYYPFLM